MSELGFTVQLAKIKPVLPGQHFETVIHAFVTTRLDNALHSALYVGVSGSSIARLQLVQNAAACRLTGTRAHFTYFSFTPLAVFFLFFYLLLKLEWPCPTLPL